MFLSLWRLFVVFKSSAKFLIARSFCTSFHFTVFAKAWIKPTPLGVAFYEFLWGLFSINNTVSYPFLQEWFMLGSRKSSAELARIIDCRVWGQISFVIAEHGTASKLRSLYTPLSRLARRFTIDPDSFYCAMCVFYGLKDNLVSEIWRVCAAGTDGAVIWKSTDIHQKQKDRSVRRNERNETTDSPKCPKTMPLHFLSPAKKSFFRAFNRFAPCVRTQNLQPQSLLCTFCWNDVDRGHRMASRDPTHLPEPVSMRHAIRMWLFEQARRAIF